MMRAKLTLAACLVPALAAFPVAAQDDDDVFDRTPIDCITVSGIDKHEAVDDQNILFYMRDRRVFRNHLPRKCPGLEREQRIAYKLEGTQRLCSINTITVLEDGIGGGGPLGFREGFTCRIGEFVPLSPEEVEDLKLLADQPRGGRRTQSTIETTEVEAPERASPDEREEPATAEPSPSADETND